MDDLTLECDEILNKEWLKDVEFYSSLSNEGKRSVHKSEVNPFFPDRVDWEAVRKKRLGRKWQPPTFETVKRLKLSHVEEVTKDRVRRWEASESRYCKLRRVDARDVGSCSEHERSSFEGEEKVSAREPL